MFTCTLKYAYKYLCVVHVHTYIFIWTSICDLRCLESLESDFWPLSNQSASWIQMVEAHGWGDEGTLEVFNIHCMLCYALSPSLSLSRLSFSLLSVDQDVALCYSSGPCMPVCHHVSDHDETVTKSPVKCFLLSELPRSPYFLTAIEEWLRYRCTP